MQSTYQVGQILIKTDTVR